jgi:hypothetical protein
MDDKDASHSMDFDYHAAQDSGGLLVCLPFIRLTMPKAIDHPPPNNTAKINIAGRLLFLGITVLVLIEREKPSIHSFAGCDTDDPERFW